MGSVRGVVLRFLEKKYALEEGELVNSKPSGAPAPPPQITPSANPTKDNKADMNRKKKTVSTDGESDGEYNSGENKKNSKSDTWMQCNKCKYTTDYHAFLVHHVRQQHKRKNSNTEGQEDSADVKQASKRYKTETTNNANSQPSSNESSKAKSLDSGDAETVEMIAAEINDFHDSAQNNTDSNDAMVIASVSQADNSDGTTSIVMARGEDGQLTALTGTDSNGMTIEVSGMVMQGVDGVEGEAMCMMPITDETTGEQIEGAEDGNVYVHVVDMSGEEVGRLPAGSVGNVARVNDDGTVEMVQVMWDQMVADNPDGDPDQNQEFTLEEQLE